MIRSSLLSLPLLALACTRAPTVGPAEPATTATAATSPAPPPIPVTLAERWTPRDVDRGHDPFRHNDATAVLRAPVDALPQTRKVDFSRHLLVAVGERPGPDAPIVDINKSDVELGVAVLWHPVWVVRGCAGRLPGHESFHASTREAPEPVWVLRRDATYRAPRLDVHVVVALVEVEVPCPQDARELLDRTIPAEAVPAVVDLATRLPTYTLRQPPTGEGYPDLDDVDFIKDIVVIGADQPVALPLRLLEPPPHAIRPVTAASYRAPYRMLACKKQVRCEHFNKNRGPCRLEYETLRREHRPVLARLPARGQAPVVTWDAGDTVGDPDCKDQPRTFTIRAADDPRAPRGVDIDYTREVLLGLDTGLPDITPATVVAPVTAAEQAGKLQVTVAVPIEEIMDVSGCEGATRRPCDPVAIPTGKLRVRPDWPRVIAGVYYRVPRSNLPVEVRFIVPERPTR